MLIGDERYSVRKEFTGAYEKVPGLMLGQRWVVRFCGKYVTDATTKEEAVRAVAAHQAEARRAVEAAFSRANQGRTGAR